MNPKDSNEDQISPNEPNDDEVDSKAVKKQFDGDIKRNDVESEMDINDANRESIRNIVGAQPVVNNETLNLMDILGEEQEDEIRALLFGVCRALQREYGDISNSLIPQFIEFVREQEFNVDVETLRDELQCNVSESEFIEHFASRFPSVFGTDSEKQKLQNLLSSNVGFEKIAVTNNPEMAEIGKIIACISLKFSLYFFCRISL